MTSEDWTLDPESETRILHPWLESEPDAAVRKRFLEWLAELVLDPRRYREDPDHPGVYFGRALDTRVGVVWALDLRKLRVMLVDISDLD